MPPVDSLPRDESTVRVLITTDNHVGYLENDPIRGDDAWRTFQEITYLAKTHDADLIVQGGDLFHVLKPLKKLLFHVVQALRVNTLGDRPCELELLSDPALLLRALDSVNYEDPNLNVAIPVFAISGNHDDATGEGLLLPLDVLAATGLVNFFGLLPASDKMTVSPLVFQKGTTRLALYGINNMRDERLQRFMRHGDVVFQKPALGSFFSLLCVHQNHFRHTMTLYVPEDFLPLFVDFVVWGHEHECISFPQYNPTTGFETLQPGSLVATSLLRGETGKKHVFLMDIRGKDYTLEALPLETVRPFLMRDVCLQDENFMEGPASKEDILAFLTHTVEELIEEATQNALASDGQQPLLPLIRVKVDHTGDYEMENPRRFSNRFVGRVANVDDILLYHKQKAPAEPRKRTPAASPKEVEGLLIQQLLRHHLGDSSLNLLPEAGLFDATKRAIDQDDKAMLQEYVEKATQLAVESLKAINIDPDEFHTADDALVKRLFRQLLNQLRIKAQRAPLADLDMELNQPELDEAPPAKMARPRAKTKVVSREVVSDELDSDYEKQPKKAPAKRKRATRS